MASIYWDMELYSNVEKIFRQSAEFCSEHEVWKLNVAHTFFMQDNHYKEAIRWGQAAGVGAAGLGGWRSRPLRGRRWGGSQRPLPCAVIATVTGQS